MKTGTVFRLHKNVTPLITARKRSLRRLCFLRCLSPHRRVSATSPSSWEDTSMGRTPRPSACWDTHTPAQCMLGYIPLLPSACWDAHPPILCSAGIRSTSGRYASHWNTFLFSNGVSFFRYGQRSFPVMHKVGSVDIFVLLKLEKMMDREVRVINCNLKHYHKCKFVLKLIMF